MELMTREILKKLPPLYSTENKKPEKILVGVKYFDPTGRMTYYATEFDPKTCTLYGYMRSPLGPDYDELGYVNLNELAAIQGRFGLGIERDLYFGKHTLKEVMENAL